MPKHPEPEWLALRNLAAEWRVNRTWLAGVVVGMRLRTSKGVRNDTLIHRSDAPLLEKAVRAVRHC